MLFSTPLAPANDKSKLLKSVNRALDSWATYAPHLEFFRQRVRRSRPVPTAQVPDDVITMNSRFVVRQAHSGDTLAYTLVYPEDEALTQGRLSVLSPMGMAVYGARVGDEVLWLSATGPEVGTVERLIYQPEAAGHHDR